MAQCPMKASKAFFQSISDETLAFWLLRLFLAVRFIHGFYGKLVGSDGSIALSNLVNLNSYIGSAFDGKLPSFMLAPYALTLPWIELFLGLAILLGVKTRLALFFTGLTYISLAFGQMLLQEWTNVGLIGLHMGFTAAALLLVRHNRLKLWD